MKKLKNLLEDVWPKDVHTENPIRTLPILDPSTFYKEFIEAGRSKNQMPPIQDAQYNNELEMGIQVEYEHTTNKRIAMKIAMDHLVEIPDYYTRLAKMEKFAKKNPIAVENIGGNVPLNFPHNDQDEDIE
jgi:hypothetical protein